MPKTYPRRTVLLEDGSVVDLDIDNPYISINDTEPLLNNAQIQLPNDLIIKARTIESMNCSIRIICLCDIFMSMYYFYINTFIALFLMSVSMSGYLSTVYYKKSLMCCYMGYQYIQTAARLSNLIYFIYIPSTALTNQANTTSTLIVINDPVVGTLLLCVLFFLQLIIAVYVTKYYKLLPSEEDKNRIRLVPSNNQP